jgi:hypothetical protein
VKPGQFFVLKFNFSGIPHSLNPDDAALALKENIAESLGAFYTTYAKYLGGDASELIKKINVQNPGLSLSNCVAGVNAARAADREKGKEDQKLAHIKGVGWTAPLLILLG